MQWTPYSKLNFDAGPATKELYVCELFGWKIYENNVNNLKLQLVRKIRGMNQNQQTTHCQSKWV